jgi:hypothetical protein
MASGFSRAVLQALRVREFSDAEVCRTARISAPFLAAVAQGKRQFTEAQMGRIERRCRLSGAQLTASVVEPSGGPLTEFAEIWAPVFRAANPSLFNEDSENRRPKSSGNSQKTQIVPR